MTALRGKGAQVSIGRDLSAFRLTRGAGRCEVDGYPTGQIGNTVLPFASLSTSARPRYTALRPQIMPS